VPLVDIPKRNFSSGELAPKARALMDLPRYANGMKRLRNWRVLIPGGVSRRAGTRYVATAAGFAVLRPFEPSTTDAYLVALSHLVMRFYKDSAYLGIQLTSPYTTADLRRVRTAQVNDVMVLVHPGSAPRRLIRTAPTTFSLSLFPFYPPPTYEAGIKPGFTLTLSGTTGTPTGTASASAFLDADAQRVIVAGTGRAVIVTVTSSTVVTLSVLDAFDTTTYASGLWTITGSPVATLTPSVAGPVGAQVSVVLGGRHPGTELANQNFTTWSDFSGRTVLVAGTHLGATNSTNLLVDNAHDFVQAGVLTTHVVRNVTDASRGIVSSVNPYHLGVSGLLQGGTENDFDTNDAYEILETGGSRITATSAQLTGGTAGHGWIETSMSVTAGVAYEIRFTIGETSASLQVGSTSKTADVYAEASFTPGEHAVTVTPTGSTIYVQFRNNQNSWATISKVSTQQFAVGGFRPSDVGSFLSLNGGLIRIHTVVDTTHVNGEIVRELSSTAAAVAGAWSLESPAWSDTLGWPQAVVLYEGRLYFGGTAKFPQDIWGSKVDGFNDFFVGTNPEDAVHFSIVDSAGNITLNVLNWLMPAENILTGTSHGEYRLIGSGDDPITAGTPPRARLQSSYGSDGDVMPIKVDQALLFPHRKGSKLREITLDPAGNTRYQTRDLTILAGHLLEKHRLVELAYSSEPLSSVWGVRADGVMVVLTYDAREEVAGWWQFRTDGAVESVAVIPHPTQNRSQVWLVVNRTAGRFIEVLDEEALMVYNQTQYALGEEDQTGAWEGLTVDAGVVYNGVATTTLTGLTHLNGQTVDIVGDGAVFPQQVVAGGQVTLPLPVRSAFVGLHYEAEAETLPPELPQGTISRKMKRWVELMVMLDGTLGLEVQGEALDICRTPSQPMDHGVRPYTGDAFVDTYGWDTDITITFAQRQPLPATVLGVVGQLDIEVEP
jgi:hypothetical protein